MLSPARPCLTVSRASLIILREETRSLASPMAAVNSFKDIEAPSYLMTGSLDYPGLLHGSLPDWPARILPQEGAETKIRSRAGGSEQTRLTSRGKYSTNCSLSESDSMALPR